MSRLATHGESFQVQRRGDVVIVVPSADVECLSDSMIEQAAQLVLAPLKDDPPSSIIFDLSQVQYFGSLFITFLLRCHLMVKKQGDGELVLAGVSNRIRELLRLTNLDTLWALYDTVGEALDALQGTD
ncbi:MAG: STAS domain-containing protein [Gemmataceae bacterium]|nr:STAS domain-containing protein [Gemmataceae bacterium]